MIPKLKWWQWVVVAALVLNGVTQTDSFNVFAFLGMVVGAYLLVAVLAVASRKAKGAWSGTDYRPAWMQSKSS